MKTFSFTAYVALAVASLAAAHMEMKSPPPLRSKFNKFTKNQDYDMTSPLSPSGSNFPCRGHLTALGTPEGQPVADWVAGQPQSMTITGGAFHGGGSCQASLSYDNGKTWKVIHSWIGSCPANNGPSSFEFTLPADAAAGEAVFAWTWFNKVGNREMYMNCAVVNIKASGNKKKRGVSEPVEDRPEMFVANVGNGCKTSEGTDVMFPDPGPDVDTNDSKAAAPVGNCPVDAPAGGKPSTATKPSAGSTKPSASPDKGTKKPGSKFPGEQNKPSLPSSGNKTNKPSSDEDEPTTIPTQGPNKPSSSGTKPKPSASPDKGTKKPGSKFPGEQNKPSLPSSGNSTNEPSPDEDEPTTIPTQGSNKPSPSGTKPVPAPAPTQIDESPSDNGVCTPGVFDCTPDTKAWRICSVTQVWVRAGECPEGFACQVNAANKTPYCTAQ
ncbi:hypothetical protein NOR_05104 [Metarhizium rileyi]|uniref:Spore coat protein SP96 n=1 Tax=Metarhizium rileyi (strain RCEF 4871) TaxID=1649241 RepID=A0A162HRP9_METRR|nr:hypothetical protein NOR_05104 [Metarhizium rileyi RCEF 4871]